MRRRDSNATGGPSLPDRWAAWRAARSPAATGFTSQPDPRSIGLYARGKQLLAGNILLAGYLIEAPGAHLWDLDAPDPVFEAEAQGFAWVDDLAALGAAKARVLAQDWTWGWIARYGDGSGNGWTPDLTGRRIIRWIHNAIFLLQGRDKAQSDAFYTSLSRQAAYLSLRWKAARPGLPRFEALVGLLYAGLSLIGKDALIAPALTALCRECSSQIDAEGGIATRNPEELLEVFTLLTWAIRALAEADRPIPTEISDAIGRLAPSLRILRHADGGLARFHGGGKGQEGRLDQALSLVGPGTAIGHIATAMGYVRLSGGRTSVILDAANPPSGRASATAHASTAGFELTSGRRPLVVSCGSGLPFGPDWRLAGRATQSHSALSLTGFSSSRFGKKVEAALLDDTAKVADLRMAGGEGAMVQLSHDGWLATHGLTATRELHLSGDGRRLGGSDSLTAMSFADRKRFGAVLDRSNLEAIGFAIRFHLHPDVDATLDMGGTAVSMQLRSGEIWVFRHDGTGKLSLDPSFYLEKGRINPRPTLQITLSAVARDVETRIGWTLAKAQDTPLAIRDLDRDDPVPL
ncbi:heparinase II/III family protein [Xinfangfangia sp. CPCC 101601]|uniref:Heparinase II/III family protein n=1 Tax=Pseudogemmobacter lacusdianii TaxID=3069608 RepID=A0ABU0VWW8_9RHOB|nr:heparinase II/III family protein [Xinfangfangia sp. CPCC 101601]MDQ2066249.1 heparinase II/III family protein [Xinfangfangia sp. CPCC 101601]